MRSHARRLGRYYLGPAQMEICGVFGAIHDITESIIPDIVPNAGISKQQKQELEYLAIEYIGRISSGCRKIRDLWMAYDSQQTEEAIFVNKLDKLHVAFTALDYEMRDASPYSLQPYWDHAQRHVANTPLQEVFESLCRRRKCPPPNKPVLVRPPYPEGTFENMKKVVVARLNAVPG